jgi:hypothetical protein
MSNQNQIVPRRKTHQKSPKHNKDVDTEQLLNLAKLMNQMGQPNPDYQIITQKQNSTPKKKSAKIIELFDESTSINKAHFKKPYNTKPSHTYINVCFDKIWKVMTNQEIYKYNQNVRKNLPITREDNKQYTTLFSLVMTYSNNLYQIINKDSKVIISSVATINSKISTTKALLVLVKNDQEHNKLYITKSSKYKDYVIDDPVLLDIDTISNNTTKFSTSTIAYNGDNNILYKLKIMNGKKNIETVIFKNITERTIWKHKLKNI